MAASTLLTLPNELLYQIFDYLDPVTVLDNVRCVCKQLMAIVDTYNHFKLDVTQIYRSDLVFLSHVIQTQKVVSLTFDFGSYRKGYFDLFCSVFKLNTFTKLRSLYLSNACYNEVDLLLKQISADSLNLNLLSIHKKKDERQSIGAPVLKFITQFKIPKLKLYMDDYAELISWSDECPLKFPCLHTFVAKNIKFANTKKDALCS